MKYIYIKGKTVNRFVKIGSQSGEDEFCIMYTDGTEEDMTESEIKSLATVRSTRMTTK